MENNQILIVEFDNDGNKLETIIKDKVNNLNWQNELSELSFKVTRLHGTEIAFSIPGYSDYRQGIYRCICCDNALFSSKQKYNSYTGWPSFTHPIDEHNVKYIEDNTLNENRVEVQCNLCDAHLGHVFDDGPTEEGFRYCMNSSALKFIPLDHNNKIQEKLVVKNLSWKQKIRIWLSF